MNYYNTLGTPIYNHTKSNSGLESYIKSVNSKLEIIPKLMYKIQSLEQKINMLEKNSSDSTFMLASQQQHEDKKIQPINADNKLHQLKQNLRDKRLKL